MFTDFDPKDRTVVTHYQAQHDSHDQLQIPVSCTQAKKARGTRQDVAWNAFCLTFPMLALTVILLTLIFTHLVHPTFQSSGLRASKEINVPWQNSYLVAFNSTFLVFLASWMSSLAPMLSTFAITLAAYPISNQLLIDTIDFHKDRLLTPFQLSLTLKILNGSSFSALWNLFLYRIGWGKQTLYYGAALQSLFKTVMIIISLSFLVFGADTWLHVTTDTISIVQTSTLRTESVIYSQSLIQNCTSTNNTWAALLSQDLVCTIEPKRILVANPSLGMQTLTNRSDIISVLNDSPDPAQAYLSVPPAKLNAQYDFTASSIGLRTQCKPITRECQINTTAQSLSYNCSRSAGSFAANSNDPGATAINQLFFSTPQMNSHFQPLENNSIYYAIASASLLSAFAQTNIAKDPDVVAMEDSILLVLFCEVNFSDVEYDRVNGAITRYSEQASNTSVPNVFLTGMTTAQFGDSNLRNAIYEAASMATDAQNLANEFALSLGTTILSVGAASFMSTPALAAQERSSVLVARVRKAPLYLLVIANLSFVVMGLTLALVAARTSKEAHEVHGRLSIEGLCANMFEGERSKRPTEAVERLFGEYWEAEDDRTTRVGINRTLAGGYVFTTVAGKDG